MELPKDREVRRRRALVWTAAVLAALTALYALAGFVLIPRLARQQLMRYAQQQLPGRQVHLLGHSLGGLIILECLRRYRIERPGRVVLLGSPLLGSRTAARLGRLGLARPLLGRAVCEQLLAPQLRRWTSERELGVISGSMPLGFGHLVRMRFGEENDGTIAVSETRIPGAKAYLTLPVSHLGLLFSARVAHEAAGFFQYGRFGV